jgi:zinc and cadmium transporter
VINLVGDALHNFIDGSLIAASYLAGPTLGLTTTTAVLCHEIPQELGDFGVLVHSGMSTRKALAVNLASASAAVAGSVATLLAGEVIGQAVADLLPPITAGGFVYIAAADLIPELQRERGLARLTLQAGLIALGIAVMAALTLVE